MRCIVCGVEMNNTIGGNYNCPQCGHSFNDLVYRPKIVWNKEDSLDACDMPMPQGFGNQGWVCPVCGAGLAPWVSVCPCMNKGLEITYEANTLEQLWNGVSIVGKNTNSKD